MRIEVTVRKERRKGEIEDNNRLKVCTDYMKVLPNCHGREFHSDKNGRQSSISLVTMTLFSKKQGSPQKWCSTMWVSRGVGGWGERQT